MSVLFSKASSTLSRAMRLGATEPASAIAELELGIVNARAEGDSEGLARLARHAAVLCARLGEVRRALQYYDEVRQLDDDDPYLYLAIGDLRKQLGEVGQARVAFSRALELARKQNATDLTILAQDVLSQLEMPP